MSKIIIENTIWGDVRFFLLSQKLDGQARAIGELVMAWRIGMEHWKEGRALIPHDAWKRQGLSDLIIDCGLAEKKEDGIYVAGVKKHFEWMFQRREAGRKGGLVSNKINNTTEANASKRKQTEANASKRKQTEAK